MKTFQNSESAQKFIEGALYLSNFKNNHSDIFLHWDDVENRYKVFFNKSLLPFLRGNYVRDFKYMFLYEWSKDEKGHDILTIIPEFSKYQTCDKVDNYKNFSCYYDYQCSILMVTNKDNVIISIIYDQEKLNETLEPIFFQWFTIPERCMNEILYFHINQ